MRGMGICLEMWWEIKVGKCWEAQCKIALKEKVLGEMAKGQKYPGIVYW